ncbi:MAG: hypothetical protein QNJ19_08670 [Woeseiaceae bacterium]|nr:hypothetical protein [Woeseiaceae bacterium]
MKSIAAALVLILLASTAADAQPYQFEQDQSAPTEIILFDDPQNEGVRLGSSAALLGGDPARLFLKGLIEFQPVDIFIAPVESGQTLKVNLVKATWEDVVDSCTATVNKACQFSVRTLGDVGISISGDNGTEYALLTVVGAEIRPQLDTPFYQISTDDLASLESPAIEDEDAAESESNTLVYLLVAAVVALLLIVVFLLGKRSQQAAMLLIAAFIALPGPADAQEEISDELRERIREEIATGIKAEMKRFDYAKEHLEKVTDVADTINELRTAKKDFDTFWSAYTGLGKCFNTGAAWSGRERIPSFCEDQEGCDNCFLAAREQFNLTRYYLGRLKTIHSCTIKMTDSAKAFGDSLSSATGSGLGWYEARQKIDQSVESLNKAYDNKYKELMGDLSNSMIEMSICEAKYGLRDWYDRFGFVYYEFMKDKYERN